MLEAFAETPTAPALSLVAEGGILFGVPNREDFDCKLKAV
jgi:hypothetical protein